MSRFKEIKENVESIIAFDMGMTTPPDWRPFLVEMLEELDRLSDRIEELEDQRRKDHDQRAYDRAYGDQIK